MICVGVMPVVPHPVSKAKAKPKTDTNVNVFFIFIPFAKGDLNTMFRSVLKYGMVIEETIFIGGATGNRTQISALRMQRPTVER